MRPANGLRFRGNASREAENRVLTPGRHRSRRNPPTAAVVSAIPAASARPGRGRITPAVDWRRRRIAPSLLPARPIGPRDRPTRRPSPLEPHAESGFGPIPGAGAVWWRAKHRGACFGPPRAIQALIPPGRRSVVARAALPRIPSPGAVFSPKPGAPGPVWRRAKHRGRMFRASAVHPSVHSARSPFGRRTRRVAPKSASGDGIQSEARNSRARLAAGETPRANDPGVRGPSKHLFRPVAVRSSRAPRRPGIRPRGRYLVRSPELGPFGG